MSRFTRQAARFTRRPARFGPFVPLAPGVLPDQTLLTENGDGLTGEDGRYLLQEMAVGSMTEAIILTEMATPLVNQDSLYLTYQ